MLQQCNDRTDIFVKYGLRQHGQTAGLINAGISAQFQHNSHQFLVVSHMEKCGISILIAGIYIIPDLLGIFMI
ncbi:hypothetical protein D3C71_2082670 [compost metagenome]